VVAVLIVDLVDRVEDEEKSHRDADRLYISTLPETSIAAKWTSPFNLLPPSHPPTKPQTKTRAELARLGHISGPWPRMTGGFCTFAAPLLKGCAKPT
jgi:hypothetical protein